MALTSLKPVIDSMLAVKINILSKQAKCTVVNADNQYNAMSLIHESWSIKTVGVNGTLLDTYECIVHVRASCHVCVYCADKKRHAKSVILKTTYS